MTLPNITVNFLRSSTPGNPQDLTAIPMVVGNCCMGPLETPTIINQLTDLDQFGSGPGVELVAAILSIAGGPVYFTRSLTSTPSTIGAVTKTPGNPIGTPVTSFGSIIALGADHNGDVLIEAKTLGVSIVIIDPGAVQASTTVNVVGPAITVTLKHDMVGITETGTGLAAAINGSMAASALVSAVALGTGASIAGAHANALLNNGALTITALTQNLSYRVLLSGTNTSFSATLISNVITVTLATDADGEPTTTAAAAHAGLSSLAAANPNTFTVSSVGNDSLLLGAKSSTPLPFGSSGSMTASGVPCDLYNVIVQIVKAGTVGGPTPVVAIWSVDGGANFSSQSIGIISPSGDLVIKDSVLDTNITVTFAGDLDIGDTFTFDTTAPITSPTDLLSGIDAAIADTQKEWGYLTSPTYVNKATAALIDNKLQEAFEDRFIYGIFNTRDLNVGESQAAWISSIITDFSGFNSARGLFSRSDGWLLWNSPLTFRQFRRPDVFDVCPRQSSIPMHEALQKVASDTAVINNTLEIYHDEFLDPGLDEQRGITMRTYAISGVRGAKYVTRGQTLADAGDIASTRLHWVRIRLAVSYNVKKYLFNFLGDQLQVIPVQESTTVPAGALAKTEADKIQAGVLFIMNVLLNTPKTDGKVSASGYTCTVPRNYSLLATGNLIVEGTITPLGDVNQITFNLGLNLPF